MHQQQNSYIPPRIDFLELFAEGNVMLTQPSTPKTIRSS